MPISKFGLMMHREARGAESLCSKENIPVEGFANASNVIDFWMSREHEAIR